MVPGILLNVEVVLTRSEAYKPLQEAFRPFLCYTLIPSGWVREEGGQCGGGCMTQKNKKKHATFKI